MTEKKKTIIKPQPDFQRILKVLKREKVAQAYDQRLKDIQGLTVPHFEKAKKISWFVYVLRLGQEFSQQDRDAILQKLKEKGIGCSNYFTPIHLQPFYAKSFGYRKGDFPITESVAERTLALPFFNNLSEEQIEYVCENVTEIIRSFS